MVTRLPISARVAVSSSEYRPSAVACAIEFIPISFWYDVPLSFIPAVLLDSKIEAL